jgi:formate dehydrogenase subunit gamma
MHRLFKEFEDDYAVSPALQPERGQTASAPDAPPPVAVAPEAQGTSGQILRFLKSERILHWSIAVPFMVCFATGMILMFFYNLHSPGLSRQVLSWLHRIAGVALILFPASTLVRHWKEYRVHLYNIRHAWRWATDDLKWLLLMLPASINRKIALPDQGKFNAAEKLNFLMVLCTYPLFIATGLLIWMPERVVLFWIVHVGMALIAAPLMLGHIYMALINPDTRVGLSGMLSGYVDRHWARHHYRSWYRENFENGATEKPAESKPAPRRCRPSPIVVLRFVTAGRAMSKRRIGISIRGVPAEENPAGGMAGNGGSG